MIGMKEFNEWLCKQILWEKASDQTVARNAFSAFKIGVDDWLVAQINAVRFNQNPPNRYDRRKKENR